MWVLYAFGSALFAGLTAILAKIGIRNTDSTVATALRTVVVLVFAWLAVAFAGSYSSIANISRKTVIYLVLSGIATGASWLCYFKALQIGDVNRVTPIDKSSTVLTMVLAFAFLHEEMTALKIVAMVLISLGTYLMIKKKEEVGIEKKGDMWIIYAVGSAVFASLTAILGKIGITNVESNLGTAIRTAVVLIMAWMIVFATDKQNTIGDIDAKSWAFLVFSGITTGGSWLCYYKALQEGPASIVVPIDKSSILVTVGCSYLFLHETLTRRSAFGLGMLLAGILVLLI